MVNVDLHVYSMCIGYAFTVLSTYDSTKQNDQWGSFVCCFLGWWSHVSPVQVAIAW